MKEEEYRCWQKIQMKQKKIDVEGEIQMNIVQYRSSQKNTNEPEEYRRIQMQSENQLNSEKYR